MHVKPQSDLIVLWDFQYSDICSFFLIRLVPDRWSRFIPRKEKLQARMSSCQLFSRHQFALTSWILCTPTCAKITVSPMLSVSWQVSKPVHFFVSRLVILGTIIYNFFKLNASWAWIVFSRSPDQCWVLGYRKSCGPYSSSKGWRYPPFWPGSLWKCILEHGLKLLYKKSQRKQCE